MEHGINGGFSSNCSRIGVVVWRLIASARRSTQKMGARAESAGLPEAVVSGALVSRRGMIGALGFVQLPRDNRPSNAGRPVGGSTAGQQAVRGPRVSG